MLPESYFLFYIRHCVWAILPFRRATATVSLLLLLFEQTRYTNLNNCSLESDNKHLPLNWHVYEYVSSVPPSLLWFNRQRLEKRFFILFLSSDLFLGLENKEEGVKVTEIWVETRQWSAFVIYGNPWPVFRQTHVTKAWVYFFFSFYFS